ncbi:hypothetical protein STEG23_002329 [Scotinomys teguina]
MGQNCSNLMMNKAVSEDGIFSDEDAVNIAEISKDLECHITLADKQRRTKGNGTKNEWRGAGSNSSLGSTASQVTAAPGPKTVCYKDGSFLIQSPEKA